MDPSIFGFIIRKEKNRGTIDHLLIDYSNLYTFSKHIFESIYFKHHKHHNYSVIELSLTVFQLFHNSFFDKVYKCCKTAVSNAYSRYRLFESMKHSRFVIQIDPFNLLLVNLKQSLFFYKLSFVFSICIKGIFFYCGSLYL